MTRLVVEVEDFADSARVTFDSVATPLSNAAVRLERQLFEVAGMAGDDHAGRTWAGSYDRAAASALVAFAGVVDGCFRLASLFGSSGRNYATAEVASTSGGSLDVPVVVARLPVDATFSALTAPPSAVGPGAGLPSGWGLLHDISGYLWPNGHQDRLHRAAHAWTAAALVLDAAADEVGIRPVLFTAHNLPEADDVETVCTSMARHLRDLAHVFRTLATACTDLAGEIDWAHSEVILDLEEMLTWIAATEAAGAGAAFFTFGVSEGVAQAAVVREVATTSVDITAILVKFASRVGDLALRIPPVEDLCADIARVMTRLRNVEIPRPAFAGVPNLPRITAVSRTGGGEFGAVERLATENVAVDIADKAAARVALPEGPLRDGANRFFRGATAKCRDFKITPLADGDYRLEYFAPANNPGYGKLYVQVIGRDGAKVTEFKDTMGPHGLIERKFQPERSR